MLSRPFRIGMFSLVPPLVMLLVIGAISYLRRQSIREAYQEAERSRSLVRGIEAVTDALTDAETGQLGFLLTGDKKYLAPYEQAVANLPKRLDELDTMASPRQRAKVQQLKRIIAHELAELRETIAVRLENKPVAALRQTERGKRDFDAIRQITADLDREGDASLLRTTQGLRAQGQKTALQGLIGSLLVLGFLLYSGVTIYRAAIGRERLISDLQQARHATAEARDLLHTTLSSIGDAVISTDAAGRVVFLNPVAHALTGWTQEEAAGKPLNEIFPIVNEQTRSAVENPVMKVLREGGIVGLANHTVLLAKNGAEIPVEDSGAPILDSAGKISGVVLTFRDVSERRQAEQAREHAVQELREREERFRFSMEAAEVGTWDWNVATNEVQWSDNMEAIHGIAPGGFGGTFEGFLADVDPDYRDEVQQALRVALEGNGQYRVEYRQARADGEYGWMEAKGRALGDKDGRPVRMVGVCMRITDRKLAEAERSRLLSIIENSPDFIGIAGLDQRVSFVNRAGLELAGLDDLSAARHLAILDYFHEDDREMMRTEALPALLTEGRWEAEVRVRRRKTATITPMLWKAFALPDEKTGLPAALAWIGLNLTERKRAEERIREAAKLESLGILAGGIAHDFNNLLTGIIGNASMLQEEVSHGSPTRALADNLMHAAERAAQLSRQMLAYSGRGRFIIEPLDLSRQARDITALLTASIPKNVALRLNLKPDLPLIEADAAQIQQLLMNLVINGAEAIAGEGSITVTTSLQELDQAYIGEMFGVDEISPGSYVVVEVEDTGQGMDVETKAKIFDPFFTTKFTGRGLGLAAALGIIRGHKGAIRVYSAPGKGTCFKVFFPAFERAALVVTALSSAGAAQGTGTILVVDDEQIVRESAKAALEKYGYTVILAANGKEAIEIYGSRKDQIALVLLDLTMPVMSGEQTLRELRDLRSGVRVVASSGFSEIETLQRLGKGVAAFIQKPYTATQLSAAVRTILGDNAGTV